MASPSLQQSPVKRVTCTAPVNIAAIKYWGKRNEQLILPLNSSLSVTLHQSELRTKTTIALSTNFADDKIWINGKEDDINNARIQRCLHEIRRLAMQSSFPDNQIYMNSHVHICSENNFPTAAGLASSAAGYACLTYCLSQVYGLNSVELSQIARQGSGSACRSMYGGFVAWNKGEREDGSDSIAEQVAPDSHWPDIEVIILVVSDNKKPISSTSGMKTSVQTSSLLQYRAEAIVPYRMDQMREAILNRDFRTFAELTMKESNQFHAVCLDTYPPISYLRDVSMYIIQLVTEYNRVKGDLLCAYSFDAGPNAVIFTPSTNARELMAIFNYYLPPGQDNSKYFYGLSDEPPNIPSKGIIDGISLSPWQPGALHYIIHTRVGPGPQQLTSTDDHLLDDEGLPHHINM